MKELLIENEAAMQALGGQFAQRMPRGCVVYLRGDLGAGKTTLVRGIIKGFGFRGKIKSPTYTLVEPYEVGGFKVYHFDLYRLSDPEELDYIGFRDYLADYTQILVEWPEHGQGYLPAADIDIEIEYAGQGRKIVLLDGSARGLQVIRQLHTHHE